jgi:hypothetical protein
VAKKLVMIEDFVTRDTIKRWLEHYRELVMEDRSIDDVVSSGGPGGDGITYSQLARIMIKSALAVMRKEDYSLYKVTALRWLRDESLPDCLAFSGLSKSAFYRRCNRAIEYVYRQVNGRAVGLQALANQIFIVTDNKEARGNNDLYDVVEGRMMELHAEKCRKVT